MRIIRVIAIASIAMLLCVSCAKGPPEVAPNDFAAPTQASLPPEDGIQEIEPTYDGRAPQVREDLEIVPRPGMSLAELVDIALRNGPTTSAAWAQARAAAAAWGISRSEYYPTIAGQVEGAIGRVRIPQLNAGQSYVSVGVGLDYLLLDFGGREARVEAARQALIAANWNHNQVIQDVLRDVPQAYYTYLGDTSLIDAAEKNLQDTRTTLTATEARHASGVATIADVLQARSSNSQAVADLAQREGAAEISRGTLATVVGWPANTRFGVAKGPTHIPVSSMAKNVDTLVEEAKRSRPDVGVAQATVLQKEAEMDDARTLPFPKLNVSGTAQSQWMKTNQSTSMYGGLTLQIPLFAGFSMENQLRQARAQYEAAKAQLTTAQDKVIKEVWDAYHNFETAGKQYTAFTALLVSAQESFNASLARYKNGAADITELLNAQNTLASARSQLIDSRMQLFTQYAELMHAVGDELPKQ